jgi:hypothetical protein
MSLDDEYTDGSYDLNKEQIPNNIKLHGAT